MNIIGYTFLALLLFMGLLAIAAAMNSRDWDELTEEPWHD